MAIDKEDIANHLKERYGYLLEEELLQEILEVGRYREVPVGEVLIELGQEIGFMPLVIQGTMRVMREDKEGNELFLYYLESGDTCAMSLNCCLGNKKSEIRAVADEPSILWLLPVSYMDPWLQRFQTWRNFVFESFNIRLNELLETIDSIAFMRMDERLLKFLLDKVKVTGNTMLSTTHQEIADNLNTSRVVISRLLKQLEKRGSIALHRNRIEVIDF